jgi:hypothetical protein
LELRRKVVEEKEAAAERRMATLMGGANDYLGIGKLHPEHEGRRNIVLSVLFKIIHWFSDKTTHLLTMLKLIS